MEEQPSEKSISYFSLSFLVKRSTHSVESPSSFSHQKQITANTNFTNARESYKKRKKKRSLCSCENTPCCEEDCETECSDTCHCPTSPPTSSTHIFQVPTRPPQRPVVVAQSNTFPVNQPITNNVVQPNTPANTGTVGLHPGIPGGTGLVNTNERTVNTVGLTGLHPGMSVGTGGLVNGVDLQQSPPQKILISIPPNQGQSMSNPNLVNLPNQALISRNQNLNPNFNPNPVINVPINSNSVPIRYTVPNQQTTNVYPNTNQANLGSNSLNYPQNQPIYTNIVGNQGLNYGNNQGQNYANQRSLYVTQALPNGIQGTNYNQGYNNVSPGINQGNIYANQRANNQGNVYVNPGSNSNNHGTNSGNNQVSNANQGVNNANEVGNTGNQGSITGTQGSNSIPLSAVRVPNSLSQNSKTSENSGNSATQGNVNQSPANVANQENNPFAPGKTLPASTANPSANPAGQTNPGGSANPQTQSGNQASNSNQAHNPFAPGGTLTSSTTNPSTNPVGSTNQVAASNPAASNNLVGQTNPGGSANPQVDNSNQAHNPFAPGNRLSSSTGNPSVNQVAPTNPAGSNNLAGQTNPAGSANPQVGNSNQVNNPSAQGGTSPSSTNASANQAVSTNTAGSSNQAVQANQPGSANATDGSADSSNSNGKLSSENNNSPKSHLFTDESPFEKSVETQKNGRNNHPSYETHDDRKELSSNRQRQNSDSSDGQQSADWETVDDDGRTGHQDKRPKPNRQKESENAPVKSNKNAQKQHLKKLMQELLTKLTKHETAGSSREMAESSLIVKVPKSKHGLPLRNAYKKGVRQRPLDKRQKKKLLQQKSSKSTMKKILPSQKTKNRGGKTPWEKVWKKFTSKRS